MTEQLILISYLLLVITPPIILGIIFIKVDIFREPLDKIIVTFLLAFAATTLLLTIFYEFNVFMIPDAWHDNHFINAFFLVALPEELIKFLVLYVYCTRLNEFNEPMDGLVYGAMAGLGFGVNEAFLYAKSYIYEGETFIQVADSILMRGIMALPSHAFDGVIMGSFIGICLFRKVNKLIFIGLAILVPTIIHGLWDYLLFIDEPIIILVDILYIVQIIAVIWLFRYFRRLQKSKIIEGELRQN